MKEQGTASNVTLWCLVSCCASHLDQASLTPTVLLQVLQYSGILFLITEREEILGDVLKSCIHLPLYFPPLEREQTPAVWKHNLKRIMEGKDTLSEADEGETTPLARQQYERTKPLILNCRQLRNAFQIATALVENGAQVRREQHMKSGTGQPTGLMCATLAETLRIVAEASQCVEA